MATEIIESLTCFHCGKQRNADQRTPCEHCGLRRRDKGLAGAKPTEDRIVGKDLVVIASDPTELVEAQQQMIARLDEKIREAESELSEMQGPSLALAIPETDPTVKSLLENARSSLDARSKRLAQIVERRIVYLKKVRAALAASYVMMPNFPGHVIAIRTARKRPPQQFYFERPRSEDVPGLKPDAALPPGEGKYVSPLPEHEHQVAGERQDIQVHGFDEDIALPVEFIKPEVVHRTVKALELKIFDEIVLIRDGAARDTLAKHVAPPRGRDPMVVGRIVLRKPGASRWDRPRVLSFLIAWFMDTSLI